MKKQEKEKEDNPTPKEGEEYKTHMTARKK